MTDAPSFYGAQPVPVAEAMLYPGGRPAELPDAERILRKLLATHPALLARECDSVHPEHDVFHPGGHPLFTDAEVEYLEGLT